MAVLSVWQPFVPLGNLVRCVAVRGSNPPWSRGGYFWPRVAARNGIPHRVPFRLPLADLLS